VPGNVDDGNNTLKLTLLTKFGSSFPTIYLRTPDEGGKAHTQYLNMQCSLFLLHSFVDILHLLKLDFLTLLYCTISKLPLLWEVFIVDHNCLPYGMYLNGPNCAIFI
jgi:hypothetical protein